MVRPNKVMHMLCKKLVKREIIIGLLIIFCIFFPTVSNAAEETVDTFMQNRINELRELVSQFEAPPTTGALNQPIDFSKIIEQNAKGAVLDNFKETINKGVGIFV